MKRKKGRGYKLKGEAEIRRTEKRLDRLEKERAARQPPAEEPPVQQELFADGIMAPMGWMKRVQ